MKIDESILEEFDFDPQIVREPVNVMLASEVLMFMKECSDRLIQKSTLYFKTDDVDEQLDCIDIVSIRLNDFVQAFMDIMLYIKNEDTRSKRSHKSLRFCISVYDSVFEDQSLNEKGFLSQILIRNEITHDYYNREIHQQKLISLMQNYIDGSLEVYQRLFSYFKENDLMDEFIDKNQ